MEGSPLVQNLQGSSLLSGVGLSLLDLASPPSWLRGHRSSELPLGLAGRSSQACPSGVMDTWGVQAGGGLSFKCSLLSQIKNNNNKNKNPLFWNESWVEREVCLDTTITVQPVTFLFSFAFVLRVRAREGS